MAVTTAALPQGLALRRAGRTALALLIPAGPLAIAVLRGVLPYYTTDSPAAVGRAISAHQAQEMSVLWLALVASFTLVPGTIAVGLQAVRRSPVLGGVAMVLSVAGFSAVPGIVAQDQLAIAGAHSGLPTAELGRLLDTLQNQPTTIVSGAIFVLGHVLGVVLLGIALLRARIVPQWAGLLLACSQPLHVVFAIAVPDHALDALAWGLTAVGYATVSLTLLRNRSPQ